MATIIDLKEHIENGGKIRRPCWDKDTYTRLDNDVLKELLLDDWEIYEEPKRRIKMKIILLAIIGLMVATYADASVYVHGYQRSNGTYVQPHWRSNPDGIKWNNYRQ